MSAIVSDTNACLVCDQCGRHVCGTSFLNQCLSTHSMPACLTATESESMPSRITDDSLSLLPIKKWDKKDKIAFYEWFGFPFLVIIYYIALTLTSAIVGRWFVRLLERWYENEKAVDASFGPDCTALLTSTPFATTTFSPLPCFILQRSFCVVSWSTTIRSNILCFYLMNIQYIHI